MKIHKNMTNLEIAELLSAISASYKLKDADKNKFRIIAYDRAATAVEHLSSEAKDLWDEGKLEEIAGIGKSIAEHLDEIFKNGKSRHFEKVMKNLPPAMFELMKIAGIGAKTGYKISNKFKSKISVKNAIRDLEKLAKKGEIAKIEGFGEDTQVAILQSIKEVKGRKNRHLLPYATQTANEVIEWLRKCEQVSRVDPLGSLRRQASTIGDIDLAVASNKPKRVLEHFVRYSRVSRVLEKGDWTASIILPGNVQVDLMVQPRQSYGSLLQHFTGSKHHNIALREYAKSLSPSLSLSEYGIRQNVKGKMSKAKRFGTEDAFYEYLGMEWIPPELREGREEIEKAQSHNIPKLIGIEDVKSDLQIHSSFDIETSHDLGESSMKDVVKKANDLGYEYIALTEHNPSHSRHSNSEILSLLKRKMEKVEKINYSITKNREQSNRNRVRKVFNSLELDILPDGRLPVSTKGLELLDFVLVSVHSSFRQSKEKMTKRVLSALSHPKVKIFAHPTARKLNKREGIELDWEKIFQFCLKNDKWLEINADPTRLDLPDFLVHEAVKKGVKITLGTDAHHVDLMDNMKYGVSVARRGWAEKSDIINCLSLNEFESVL